MSTISDMGQTNPTRQVWNQAFPAKHQICCGSGGEVALVLLYCRDIEFDMKLCLEEATKKKLKTEAWAETSVLFWSLLQSVKLLKCTMEEADVHCGPRLQEMYRPGHMEVDGGIQLVSTGPQRAYSSTQDEDWGVAWPLPHKWTTQQNPPKGKS